MLLHFVPVDGVEYFSGILGRERYVFMFLRFQKTSLWTRPQAVSTGTFLLHKNIKTYLSRAKKGTFKGLAGVALSRG
jgi:hypothetical protein